MAELDFPLGKTPLVRSDATGTVIVFSMTGEPDELWCELFEQRETFPTDADIADAVVDYEAHGTGHISLTLRPRTPDGVIVRAFEWLRVVATGTNDRRETLIREAERLQLLAARWADQQVVI